MRYLDVVIGVLSRGRSLLLFVKPRVIPLAAFGASAHWLMLRLFSNPPRAFPGQGVPHSSQFPHQRESLQPHMHRLPAGPER